MKVTQAFIGFKIMYLVFKNIEKTYEYPNMMN